MAPHEEGAPDRFVAAGIFVTNDPKYVNMADVNFKAEDEQSPPPGPGGRLIREPLSGDESPEIRYIELLFFAYRDFTSDPDAVLAAYGFGRAHHRVVHFVNRNPGIRVADLLDILKITKQSLGRVLKQLIDGGFIEQVQGPQDRRQRLLYPTEAGRAPGAPAARAAGAPHWLGTRYAVAGGAAGRRAIPEDDHRRR